MQTMSGMIKKILTSICIALTISASASKDILILKLDETKVSIVERNHQIVGIENGRDHIRHVSSTASKHLALAYDTRIISKSIDKNRPLFIVLSREPSRPNTMGRGYCGAGYEEYLLLIEVSPSRIDLRDELLLQSCLKSVSMLIEHGDDRDDAGNGLTANSDGSFTYRVLNDKDHQVRNLALSNGRFKVNFLPVPDHTSKPINR